MRRVRGQRLAAVVAALAAAGALPGAAGAKELTAVSACGVHACRTAHDADAATAVADEAMRTGPPVVAGERYDVRLHVTHDGEEMGSWTVHWFPSAGVIRMRGETGAPRWYEPSFPGLLALRRLTSGLRPVPTGGKAARPDTAAARPERAATARDPAPPAARRSTPTAAPADGSSSRVWLALGAAAAAVALAAAALASRRRRIRRPDAPPA